MLHWLLSKFEEWRLPGRPQPKKPALINVPIYVVHKLLHLFPLSWRPRPLVLLAWLLRVRHTQLRGIDDLEEAIVLGRKAVSLCPSGHPGRLPALGNLTNCISIRHEELGRIDDLNEAIVLGRDVLSLCPPGHSHRWQALGGLATNLSRRHEKLGGTDDRNEAIALGRDALLLCPPGHPGRAMALGSLASNLSRQYQELGRVEDLNEATVLHRDALSLCPPGHPFRWVALSALSNNLCLRYRQFGGMDDLNEAISLARDALLLCPRGHPGRFVVSRLLADYLSTLYEQLGGIDNLNEAIVLGQDALSLCPPAYPDRLTYLGSLANNFARRYTQLGGIDDLNEAIVLGRDALLCSTSGHLTRLLCLISLAMNLSLRFYQLGGLDDLNETIVLERDALSICPPGYLDKPTLLRNLARHISAWHEWGSRIDKAEEDNFLLLHLPGQPERLMSLGTQVNHLPPWYKQGVGTDGVEEAVVLCRDALSLCPTGHLGRLMVLIDLSSSLSLRYKQLGGMDDLSEAINLGQDALLLSPPENPVRLMALGTLSMNLFLRYRQLGGMDDLDEAIVLGREASSLCPLGHPQISTSLRSLAWLYLIRFAKLGQAGDKEESFNLYAQLEHTSAVSSSDVFAAKAWANSCELLRHSTTLLAYKTALRLLTEHMASLPSLPQHLTVLKSLSSSLAVDAFSACLRNQSPIKAVELLEQGRAVFWSQLSRLRSPLDDVTASGPEGKRLADEYTRLTSLVRATLHSSDTDQHDRVCRLNVELQKVVSEIRKLPGLSRFLLPSLFSDLQRAASEGPVIIMNASKYGCDALIVFADKDPVHIPLSVTKQVLQGLSTELRGHAKLARKMDMKKELLTSLRELWDRVVSDVVDVLRKTCPPQSRIWWCPTAEFSFLPLHAAAPFRKGQKSVSDLYTSSYTTTLTALIRSRQAGSADVATEKRRFIAIGQAAAKDAEPLLSVGTELTNIGQVIGGHATFTHIEGEETHISRVAEELGKHDWVHFSCHGIPNQERPFESGFALHDGRFTVQHIIQCNIKNPEFAYLSACHTTVGDQESPDEVIHLASAMQFAGFRSVIGTMWAVDDAETNQITSTFYKHMVDESGRLDHTRAALALHKTMKSLKNIPIDQRILYIHLGA